MSTFSKETSIYYSCMAKPFADTVGRMTGGRVEIKVFPGGVLHHPFKGYQAVQDGLVEMTHAHPIFIGSQDPTNRFFSSGPVSVGADAITYYIYNSGFLDIWTAYRNQMSGLQPLILGITPTELFGHGHVRVQTGADLKGVRYRILGEWGKVAKEKYGASPVVVSSSELFGMLEKKAIDLMEYSTPSENVKTGYNEVAKYIMYPGLHAPAGRFELVMKKEKWDSFPEDIQFAMKASAKLTTFECLTKLVHDDLDAMEKLEKGGNELVKLDPAFMKEAEEAVYERLDAIATTAEKAGNPWPRRVLDNERKFKAHWKAHSKYLLYSRD
ncbi:MAG: hypothetical protein H6906_00555 [Hyphomicrobiales bacterium]|nr:hypothetical protein [Hyphomicrobiales bacterium]